MTSCKGSCQISRKSFSIWHSIQPLYSPINLCGRYFLGISITSKAKGKSGGARILTYNVKKVNPEKYVVVLMSIYDKSEMENVSDNYLKDILKEAKRLV